MIANKVIYYFICDAILYATAVVTPLLTSKSGQQEIQTISWNCVRRLEAVTKWQFVQSRGYPRLLNVKKSRCTWKIVTRQGMRIRLAFQGIDLYADDQNHCSSNYIEIIDETLLKSQARFCGKKTPNDMVSAGNSIRIDFQAQPGIATNSKGFSIGYSRTLDPAGFYSWQSFGPKKRPEMLPPPPPRNSFVSLTEDDDEGILLTNDARLNAKDDVVSIESVVGGLLGMVAILLIMVLMWKNRRRIIAFKNKQDKEKQSTSTESYPLPPQSEIDPFERIMSSVEPYPAPVIEEDRLSELPSLPTKQKCLPMDRVSILSGEKSVRSSHSRTSSRPPSRSCHQPYLPRQQSRLNRYRDIDHQPGFPRNQLNLETKPYPVVNEHTMHRTSSRMSYPVRTQSRDSLRHSSSRQSRTMPKLYLPEVSLPPPYEEDDPNPPPLPLKEKDRRPQDDHFQSSTSIRRSLRRHRTLSRASSMHDENGGKFFPRSRSHENALSLDEKWHRRSKSISNLTEIDGVSRFSRQTPNNFDRMNRFQESFKSQKSRSAHRKSSTNKNVDDLRMSSDTNRRTRSFTNIPDANKIDKNAKWSFLDPSEQDYNLQTVAHQTMSRRHDHNLGRRTMSRASSRSAANIVLPPPLPVKKRKINPSNFC